jgi:cytochrome c6
VDFRAAEVIPVRARAAAAGLLWLALALPAMAQASSSAMAAKGQALFNEMCSHCHGLNMVNPGTSAFDLRQFPHDEEKRFRHSVTVGKGNMPAWGDLLKPDEISELWAYVKSGGKP